MVLNAKLQAVLPDLGLEVAIDGKIIQSYANKVSTKEPDGRRETQADTTAKIYCSNNGTKTMKYFFDSEWKYLTEILGGGVELGLFKLFYFEVKNGRKK